MALFNKFPFSNAHELNLDWILRQLKDLLRRVKQLEESGGGGGGGGTDDYNDLSNKPSINGVTLIGNKNTSQIGITIPAASSATPRPLGTAAAGSSTDYARADHVHKKPTAGDLGITVPIASTSTPAMDGTGAPGSSANYARGDHIHPTDTTRASVTDLAGKADKITEVTVSTAGDVTQALDAEKIYHFTGALTSLTITLNAAGSGHLAQYHFDFESGSTAPTLTLPNTVIMPNGFQVGANKHYEIDILDGYGVAQSW